MKKKSKSELYGIIGLGRFGSALAQMLASAGKEIIVIDSDEDKIKEATALTDYAYSVKSLSKESLQEVGIQNCDTVIVCIGQKIDVSIMTTLNVINLGVKQVISKAISAEQGDVLKMIGAQVVYPERDMAIRLGNKLLSPCILDYIALSDEVNISEVMLTNKVNNLSILELNLRQSYGLNIIAVKHEGKIETEIVPDMKLHSNDTIVIVGKVSNIRNFESYLEV